MGYWHPEAKKQLHDCDIKVIEKAEELINEFEEEGLDHEKVGKVKKRELGLNLWRLKIDPENEGVNHRVFLDEFYDQFVYYGIYQRDTAYEIESLLEVLDRLYSD